MSASVSFSRTRMNMTSLAVTGAFPLTHLRPGGSVRLRVVRDISQRQYRRETSAPLFDDETRCMRPAPTIHLLQFPSPPALRTGTIRSLWKETVQGADRV